MVSAPTPEMIAKAVLDVESLPRRLAPAHAAIGDGIRVSVECDTLTSITLQSDNHSAIGRMNRYMRSWRYRLVSVVKVCTNLCDGRNRERTDGREFWWAKK